MSDFHHLANLVRNNFAVMSEHELFVTIPNGNDVWAAYLAAFPEGTNPIFRERTEHDCSCCRNFIRNVGSVVAIIGDRIHTVWDSWADLPAPYNTVACHLQALVTDHVITSVFRTDQRQYGAEQTFETLEGGGQRTWNHFVGKIADRHYTKDGAQVVGDLNTTAQVFHRGLVELSPEAFDTVIGLIEAKNLYRGEEFLPSIKGFHRAIKDYKVLSTLMQRDRFIWSNLHSPATRFRNTAIGTLLVDLSEGMELEAAVRSFEQKVAPTNYKRTTALITPRMIEDALKTVDDLGLRSALERRHAKLSDISVNNVIWADNSAQALMKDSLADLLSEGLSSAPKVTDKNVIDIGIEDFMANIVPLAKSMAAFFKGAHQANLMSITAPADPRSLGLFKWDNNFAWSYNGNITDSIKEKVKAAGGNTNAALRISLAWFNADDLDLHVYTPDGTHIAWNQRHGCLDVDMNGMDRHNAVDPVENVSFKRLDNGVYSVVVHNYNARRADGKGFVIEVEHSGQVVQFSRPDSPKNDGKFSVGTITVRNGAVTDIQFDKAMTGSGISQEKWGLKTEQFVKVNTLMYSPNHWDDMAFGNKHWFFILEGCLNDEPTRGIYNEFLDSALDKHRKVFEVLGAKTMCPPVADQLSGLGFSSTKGDSVLVQVTGDKVRATYNVKF